jgi:hypothetical protein
VCEREGEVMPDTADAFRARALAWFQRKGAPYELVDGRWQGSTEYEPNAVVVYSDEPSPETGHEGWVWWARGRMGEARSLAEAKQAAEAALAKGRKR